MRAPMDTQLLVRQNASHQRVEEEATSRQAFPGRQRIHPTRSDLLHSDAEGEGRALSKRALLQRSNFGALVQDVKH